MAQVRKGGVGLKQVRSEEKRYRREREPHVRGFKPENQLGIRSIAMLQ